MPVWSGPGKYGPLRLTWEGGHLVVNSGNANQSYGNLHAIWQQCLGDLHIKTRAPRSILILGFGAGSAAAILRNEIGIQAPILGVDGDPEMLRLAKSYFKMGQMPNLQIVQADALSFANAHTQRHDLVLVDLCHELDLAPGVDEVPFIARLRQCTENGGILCFNTIVHDRTSGLRSQRTGDLLRQEFTNVKDRLYQGINRVWTAS